AASGGGGDVANDAITLAGSESANNVVISGVGSSVSVLGLPLNVTIDSVEPVQDTLTVNLGGGNDALSAANLPITTLNALTIDAGADNDTIIASPGNDTISGNLGNDSIAGGAGVDQLLAGTGNDTVQGDAGADFALLDNG